MRSTTSLGGLCGGRVIQDDAHSSWIDIRKRMRGRQGERERGREGGREGGRGDWWMIGWVGGWEAGPPCR